MGFGPTVSSSCAPLVVMGARSKMVNVLIGDSRFLLFTLFVDFKRLSGSCIINKIVYPLYTYGMQGPAV